jgi:hypothetical protein
MGLYYKTLIKNIERLTNSFLMKVFYSENTLDLLQIFKYYKNRIITVVCILKTEFHIIKFISLIATIVSYYNKHSSLQYECKN